jgi:hypothetical protein
VHYSCAEACGFNRPGEPNESEYDGPRSQKLLIVVLGEFGHSERQTMGKHARKRQRKERPTESVVPLGTAALLDDDADKDDEERRLESLLFGKPFVSGRKTKVTAIEDSAEEGDDADATAAELEGMLDSDVSYHHLTHPSFRSASHIQSFFLWTTARRRRRVR